MLAATTAMLGVALAVPGALETTPSSGRVFRRRTIGAGVLLALIPVAVAIPALAALALVGAVCSLVVAYEAIRYRTHRVRVRHPDLVG